MVDTTICKGLTYFAQNGQQSAAGIYHDTLQMATGCDSIVTTHLKVKDCPLLIWFPNAFTPNGDGLNDFFRPVGANITRYKLQIFNRWGIMIFESKDISSGWNGYFKGSMAAPDVYTFDATYETSQFPGVVHHEKGTFTLTR
jgi:gliding motility-associated-like protein